MKFEATLKSCIMVDRGLFEKLKAELEVYKTSCENWVKISNSQINEIIKLKQKYEPETLEM